MAAQLAPLNLKITGSANGLSIALGKAQRDIQGFASSIAGKLATIAPGLSLGALGGFGLKAAADVEVVNAKFKALTGSVEGANDVVKKLRDLAAETPLTFEGASKAAATLLAYNIQSKDLIPTIQMLGDVALGNQEKLDRLAIAFGQVSAKGKLMAQEVNQMVENGFNPLVEISRITGISMNDLFKKMEAGQISFAMVIEAFKSATSEGGRFYQALKLQGETLTGRISQLTDKIQILAAKIGEVLLPIAKDAVIALTNFVEWMGTLDLSTAETTAKIVALVAAFGTAVVVMPKIIALGKQIVSTLKAIATAQSITQALGGPAGWASLAAGIAAAGAAVYGVDKLFDSMAESQAAAARQSQAVAGSLDKVKDKSKEVSSVFDKLKEDTKSLEDAQKKASEGLAERFRDSLASPAEKYIKTIEELSKAVLEGGLEMEFFARGVERAREELEKASQVGEPPVLKAILKGSTEDMGVFRNRVAAPNAVQDAVRQEVEKLKQRIADAEKQKPDGSDKVAAKLDQTNTKLDELKSAIEANRPNTRTANF